MTTDEQTLTDSGAKTIQRTGTHASRHDEVLFFSTAHFLFFNFCHLTLHTFGFAQPHKANPSQNQKSAISPRYFNILHMKRLLLLITLFFACVTAYSQNLSLNELFALCNKPNWDEVNEYMLKKGWEYHESSKGDDTHYNTITWSYEKEYYKDKAKG